MGNRLVAMARYLRAGIRPGDGDGKNIESCRTRLKVQGNPRGAAEHLPHRHAIRGGEVGQKRWCYP